MGDTFNILDIAAAAAKTELIIFPSAARTSDTISTDISSGNALGGHFIFDVTAVTALQTVTMRIEGKDPLTGDYYEIGEGPDVGTVSLNTLKIYPGVDTPTADSPNNVLSKTFRVVVVHSGGGSFTYSVNSVLIP